MIEFLIAFLIGMVVGVFILFLEIKMKEHITILIVKELKNEK